MSSAPSRIDRLSGLIRWVWQFVTRDIWELDFSKLSGVRQFLLRQAKMVIMVVQGLSRDRCFLRASAFTYVSLLSLVPFLALVFSVARGLGAWEGLKPIIKEHLAVQIHETIDTIFGYVEKVDL